MGFHLAGRFLSLLACTLVSAAALGRPPIGPPADTAACPSLASGEAAVTARSEPEPERAHYVPFSKERFAELERALENTATGHPFSLPGLTRDAQLTFWVQSYSDTTVGGYVQWAMAKMARFDASKPTPEQEAKLKPFLALPPTRETMYQFLRLVSDKQLGVLGY
jgi:hypothetical protein